jgi:hypothetical protein
LIVLTAADFSGTRVYNPYLTENLRPDMPNQEELMSCSAACGKKLLSIFNVDKAESEIRALANYHPVSGIGPDDLAVALNALQSSTTFVGGCVYPRRGQTPEDMIRLLSNKGLWMANLQMPGKHSVIVTGLANDIVSVLDPWGLSGPGSACGTSATISLADFVSHWRPSLHAVFPK